MAYYCLNALPYYQMLIILLPYYYGSSCVYICLNAYYLITLLLW